ncbi:MAG: hypothetical protein M3680_30690 [Myxococcota bacterium]|nr:hypothetical protein [Myxococcota bacterium]
MQLTTLALVIIVGILAAGEGARADEVPAPPAAPPPTAAAVGPGFTLELGGYGELGLAFHDHGIDRNRPGGALDDRRLELDTTRVVFAIEGSLPAGLEFEAEVELAHGGTGAAREIEYDEFGEFEQEVEQGGEVVVEELHVKRTFAGRYQLAAGRFYVALGHLASHYRPTDYLGAERSEAETTIFPGQWDEMGIAFTAALPRVRLTAQVVNGLDSAGFGSRAWVASGHQGAYETIRASSLAAVARVDIELAAGTLVGAAAYVGGSSRNRPKADLVAECAAADRDNDDVAPCGYIAGTVAIGEVHARWAWRGLRGQALAVVGYLENADAISARNDRLSNDAGVERTPVADNAIALAAELGYDVAPHVGAGAANELSPFVRFDHLDTMARVRAALFDNPRFERTLVGAGVAYTYGRAFTAKLELQRRWYGSSELRAEHTVRATTGFVF